MSDTSMPPQEQPTPGSEVKMNPEPEVIRDSYRGSEKLKGSVALVTGGDSGIGRSAAVHFAREGANVAIVYLSEDQDAEETKSMIEREGQQCLLLQGDLRDRSFGEACVEKTYREFGRLDILVNNAAEQHPAEEVEEIDFDLMENTFKTNIFAMFYITKPALAKMGAERQYHQHQQRSSVPWSSVTARLFFQQRSHYFVHPCAEQGRG